LLQPSQPPANCTRGAIAATDFFTVEVVTSTDLVRYFVLFVIDLKSRRVQIAGIAHQVYGKWTEQVAQATGFKRWLSARHALLDSRPQPAVLAPIYEDTRSK
jgi:hypothetical protein